jgi:hypothetical protein
MANVDVKATGELMRVFLDGTKVQLGGDGTGSRALGAGDHVISWVARGAPGSSYSVQITAPAAAAFKKQAKHDDSQLDAGLHFFKV